MTESRKPKASKPVRTPAKARPVGGEARPREAAPTAGDLDGMAALSGSVAHDLNNMLTVILGNVESALADTADPRTRRKLERTIEAAQRAERLTARLLAVARRQQADRRAGAFNLMQSVGDIVGRSLPALSPQIVGGVETILMVEDNADVMEMGAGILEDLGYSVMKATSADEALAILKTAPEVDMLFTDIVMPGKKNGLALARAVRRTRPGVALLLTTGWADRDLGREADQGGFELIGKPYRRGDLARKVRVLLDGRSGAV